jgi:hypothetical protein
MQMLGRAIVSVSNVNTCMNVNRIAECGRSNIRVFLALMGM